MTREEKQLLFIDLCAKLPYEVICKLSAKGADVSITEKLDLGGLDSFIFDTMDVLPYLRPMSSMIEEERLKLSRLTNDKFKFYLYSREPEIICYEKYNYLEGLKVLDWLNAHHFDFRGLIPMGLAIEAPEGMYKNE